MCIVILTTAHPDYALIVIDNRDEFVLRPTSRPHWWTPNTGPAPATSDDKNHISNTIPNGHPPEATPSKTEPPPIDILSSRDLQRAEQGTWFGISRRGNFAVLTNFKEEDPSDAQHPVHGQRSRGRMVTAWLGAPPSLSIKDFVKNMLEGGETKGVGGFSLICGRLRRQMFTKEQERTRQIAPLAVISNRNDEVARVPWICGERGETHALSNTSFVDMRGVAGKEGSEAYVLPDGPRWPKVRDGERKLSELVARVVEPGSEFSEEEFVQMLFQVLDEDSLPKRPGMNFLDVMNELKESIFIDVLGDEEHWRDMELAKMKKYESIGLIEQAPDISEEDRARRTAEHELNEAADVLQKRERPDEQITGFMRGLYGTQRQTVMLVDWDGNVTYVERALFNDYGEKIPKGLGDTTFKFKVEGWDS